MGVWERWTEVLVRLAGRERFGRFEIRWERLPGSALGLRQQGRLVEQGAHAVELDAPG